MRTRSRLVFAAVSVLAASAFAQTPARPEFEAASFRLNPGCGNGQRGAPLIAPGRLTLPCTTLRGLVRLACAFGEGPKRNPKALNIEGGPAWLDTTFYDLNAKAAESNAPIDQITGPMLRALLEDRCKLKIHKESREVRVYALTVANGGAKFQASKAGSCVPIDINNLAPRATRPKFCGSTSMTGPPGTAVVDGYGLTMPEFAARMIEAHVDRPVIDRTGLTGMFDFHLEYAPDRNASGVMRLNGVDTVVTPPATPDNPGLSIFTAVQEQLGLKLSPDKGPIDVLVIDSIEKPSEN